MNPSASDWKKPFFTIAAGQTVSLIGSSAVQFSLIWWLASSTDSPLVLAWSGLFSFLPNMLLGPFAGVWIDRCKRRHVVIAADLAIGLIALLFAGWFLAADPPYWAAFLVLGGRSLGNVFHAPAIQALVPLIVPADQLMRANGWNQFMQSGAFMLGPALGAVMFAVLPMPVILLTDFVGAVIASAAVAAVRVEEPGAGGAQSPDFVREWREGFAVLLGNRRLLSMMLTIFGCMIFFLPLSSYYPLMASSYFNVSVLHGGLVEIFFAGGMMAAASLIGLTGDFRHKIRTALLGLFGIGATSLLCGLLPTSLWAFWVFAVLCGLMGAFSNLYGIPFISHLQETVAPEAQGRVFSLMGSLLSLAMPIGLAISGPVAELRGAVLWFLLTGVAMLVLVAAEAAFLLLYRSDRRGRHN